MGLWPSRSGGKHFDRIDFTPWRNFQKYDRAEAASYDFPAEQWQFQVCFHGSSEVSIFPEKIRLTDDSVLPLDTINIPIKYGVHEMRCNMWYVICGNHMKTWLLNAVPLATFQGNLVVWLERVQLFPTISLRRKMFWCWWRPMQPRQSALQISPALDNVRLS